MVSAVRRSPRERASRMALLDTSVPSGRHTGGTTVRPMSFSLQKLRISSASPRAKRPKW